MFLRPIIQWKKHTNYYYVKCCESTLFGFPLQEKLPLFLLNDYLIQYKKKIEPQIITYTLTRMIIPETKVTLHIPEEFLFVEDPIKIENDTKVTLDIFDEIEEYSGYVTIEGDIVDINERL